MPNNSPSVHDTKETWFEWFTYHMLSLFLALGLSLLSFVGLLQLLPITPLGIAAFVFTAVIVVSVYRPSIKKGLKRLFAREYSQREQAKWALLRDFDEQPNRSVDHENSKQLTEYVQSVLGGTDAHDHPLIAKKIATLSQWQIRSASFFCFLLALCAGISLFIFFLVN